MATKPTKTPKRVLTLKSLLYQLDNKAKDLLGDGVLDPKSPVRDETVGDFIDMLIKADYGLGG